MPIYEFVTIDRTDGPFQVPGEIVETIEDSPHSKQRFTALVRLDDPDVVEEDNGEEEIEFCEIPGIGDTVATRLKAEGYVYPSDLDYPEEIASEVKGLGLSRAREMVEFVEENE